MAMCCSPNPHQKAVLCAKAGITWQHSLDLSALSNLKPIAFVDYKGMSFLGGPQVFMGILNGEYEKYLRD